MVKLYACPQGQAAVTADTLRNEYGVIPGVRVAADERTSQVIVQAPPEVQSRISQRLAAAFPDLQPAAEKAAAGPVEVRQIPLKRIQADQLEAALWSTLGNRLTAMPEQRACVARLSPGIVGRGDGHDLDRSGDQAGQTGRFRRGSRCRRPLDPGPRFAARPGGPECPADALATGPVGQCAAGGFDAFELPAARRRRPCPWRPCSCNRGPMPRRRAAISAARFRPFPRSPTLRARRDAGGARRSGRGEKPAEFGNLSRIVNPVQMEVIDGLDVLVLRGSAQDVEQMMEVVRQIERLSAETEPAIEILMMKHIDCEAMATLVKALYDEVYMARQGAVSITPLAMPNAILIVGRPENVKTVKDLVARLDQPAVPGAQFQVFHLRYASAVAAQTTIQNFFVDRGGLSPAVHVTADPRSTALIVQASPRDMAEVAELIRQIDVIQQSTAVNEVRIIRLEHTLAQDIATIMQTAIGISTTAAGQAGAAAQGGQPFGQGGQQPGGPGGQPFGQGQNAPACRAAGHPVLRVAGKASSGPPCSAFSRSMPKAAGC